MHYTSCVARFVRSAHFLNFYFSIPIIFRSIHFLLPFIYASVYHSAEYLFIQVCFDLVRSDVVMHFSFLSFIGIIHVHGAIVLEGSDMIFAFEVFLESPNFYDCTSLSEFNSFESLIIVRLEMVLLSNETSPAKGNKGMTLSTLMFTNFLRCATTVCGVN